MLIELWICDALIIFPIHCFKRFILKFNFKKIICFDNESALFSVEEII